MAHYTKKELELFRQKKMSVLGKISCSAHLRHCPQCSALLEELNQEDNFLEDLKESIQILDTLAENTPIPGSSKNKQRKN